MMGVLSNPAFWVLTAFFVAGFYFTVVRCRDVVAPRYRAAYMILWTGFGGCVCVAAYYHTGATAITLGILAYLCFSPLGLIERASRDEMISYIFVTTDHSECEFLSEYFSKTGLPLTFSNITPVIRIEGLDAIWFTLMDYDYWGGPLNYDLRNTVVREATADMRERGLPAFLVVSGTLGKDEDPFALSSSVRTIRSVRDAVDEFNEMHFRAIRKIAFLLDKLRSRERGHTNEAVASMLSQAFE